MSVNISNGDTVNVKDLDMPAESAILYEGVSQLDVTPAIAKTIVNSYTGGISPAEYIYGVRDAIRFGKIGAKAYLDQGTFTKGLTKIQREEFYKIGVASEDVKTKSAPKKAITTRGKITFKGVDRSKLNYRQKASVDALDVISRV
ncbi:hypothetical protein RCJ22_05285, partial [Vibrio sp. FNV 38]|nr:hypothetical protein [Vibrio sp. FNV 38]